MSESSVIASLGKPMIRDPRTTSLDLHAHLRRLITSGALAPGTILKQAELARIFEVSRTPLREAFRMLQEEGLIEADLNQRPRVRGLDADELDQLYASRIALEALGARVTTGRLSADEIDEGRSLLRRMDEARGDQAMPEWLGLHRRFHQICTARAGGPLARAITSYGEQSERYLLTYQAWHPDSFARAHREHVAILRAVGGSDSMLSGCLMAEHLSHTAMTVLRDLSVDLPARAVVQALAMVSGTLD
ncbi:GntR family transcriptional regulator [Kribbella sp. NPDC050470]|uniref:GntR family transcriptional regulator n=1 Tax=unclassified Kribbella TaxID=2644121 RepID=UPI0037B24281